MVVPRLHIPNSTEAAEKINRLYPGWWEKELKESWGTFRDSQHCPQQFSLFNCVNTGKRFEHLLREWEQMWFSGASEKLNQTRKVWFAYPLPAGKWIQNGAQRISREVINRPGWRKREKNHLRVILHESSVPALGQCPSLQLHPSPALCSKPPQHKPHLLKWLWLCRRRKFCRCLFCFNFVLFHSTSSV